VSPRSRGGAERQSFRILVELLTHRAYKGGTALLLAPFASRLPPAVLAAWNTMGLVLLAWVVGVAVLSLPTPLQRLWPDNVWVAHAPYVWLPTVLVPAALLGHIALFRQLGPPSAWGSRRADA